MKNVNFVPKNVQRFLSSHKISEKYNEQKVFHKKDVLKKFPNIHWKTPVLESVLLKNADFQACNYIKKETPTQAFSCKF